MKLTGHLTESIYRRYAITDSAMLQEAAVKLAALHAAEAPQATVDSEHLEVNCKSPAKVSALSRA